MKAHVYRLWEHQQQEQRHRLQQQAQQQTQQQAQQLVLKWQLESQLATRMMVLVMLDSQLQRQAAVESSKDEAFVIHRHSSIKMIINNMSRKDKLIGKNSITIKFGDRKLLEYSSGEGTIHTV